MSNSTELLNSIAKSVKDATFQTRSKTDYLELMNDSQDYILDKLECLIKIDTSLTLTANIYEYAVPVDFLKFPSKFAEANIGFVSVGTNGKVPLTPTATEILDLENASWKNASSGTPEKFAFVDQGNGKLIIFPAPSTAWLAANGNTITLKYVYKPSDIIEDTNSPFDNSVRLRKLQPLLKMRVKWYIQMDDGKFEDADRLIATFNAQLDEQSVLINSLSSIVMVGFSNRWKTTG
jgi:hypothetical protein